jgi:hypothetical protein
LPAAGLQRTLAASFWWTAGGLSCVVVAFSRPSALREPGGGESVGSDRVVYLHEGVILSTSSLISGELLG